MFICHGSGSNGKNVILDMMTRLFGDHVLTINPEALMATKYDADGERATPVARQLAGARMAICSESRNTHQLDVATVKKHTGGGFMSARALHQAPINFEISHKVWLMTNHVPSLDHMDDAMRGRLHLVPFDRRWNRPGVVERDETLPDGDKTLPDKLKREAEGILAWVVAGAVRYCADGLVAPEVVTQSTTEYFQEQDGFNAWLDSIDRVDDLTLGMTATEAHEHYQAWCKDRGRSGVDISVTAFGRRLGRTAIAKGKKRGVIRYAIRDGGLSVRG
jgi:putative DNA primase/helicase